VSLAVLFVAAALAAPAIPCKQPGEWPHTRDAAWLAQVLHRAGYARTDCTGSAFVIRLGGRDLYVWAFTSGSSRFPHMRALHVGGATVHVEARLRAVWRARRRLVWVEAGPTSHYLPRLSRLAPLIRASLQVG